MNKHKKLAIFIAPLLIVIGYICSDYYLESEAQRTTLFQLQVESECDILKQQCILTSGDFKINVLDKNGLTTVNANYPLDSAILFLVSDNTAIAYPLKMSDNPYYWHSKTPLRKNFDSNGLGQKLRLIAKIKGGQYIAEFNTPYIR